jgi:CheY-like chemotaxis protein
MESAENQPAESFGQPPRNGAVVVVGSEPAAQASVCAFCVGGPVRIDDVSSVSYCPTPRAPLLPVPGTSGVGVTDHGPDRPVVRLLVVDDSATLRTLLSKLFDGRAGIEVVGQCADGGEVVTAASEVHPDVVLMDVSMPVVDGPEATRLLLQTQPAARVLMLSGSRNSQDLTDAVDAGAVGYLTKKERVDVLAAAIRTVAAGGTAWPDRDL